jgi:photosystem II stability/assembly factor-like uncharacterized protein
MTLLRFATRKTRHSAQRPVFISQKLTKDTGLQPLPRFVTSHARGSHPRSPLSHWGAIGRAAASVVVLGSFLQSPGTASANGAFPTASQLKSDPDNPDHLVLGTTFGLLVTRDEGESWDWVCETGALYRDVEPPMLVLPGGRILLAVPDGISRSDEAGCDFELATGLAGLVRDLTRVAAEPATVVAVSTYGTVAQVWRSVDAGASFEPLGAPVENLIVQTIDVAPSDPDVIYLSGTSGVEGALFRSEDRGATFERFVVPNTSTARVPYIAAIDPHDAETVYVRLTGTPSSLLVTRNGGQTFASVLGTVVPLAGFALTPDGESVVVSNGFDGTFRARTDRLEFEKVACGGPSCLLFGDSGLFGCGDNGTDGYVVGRSNDLGATFERSVDLSCIRGPVACGPQTSVGSLCPEVWPQIQMQIGALACEPPKVEPYDECFAGAGGDSGAGAASGVGGSGASGGDSGRAGAASGASGGRGAASGAASNDDSSCGCRVARDEPARLLAPGGGALLWLLRRRRRTREPS